MTIVNSGLKELRRELSPLIFNIVTPLSHHNVYDQNDPRILIFSKIDVIFRKKYVDYRNVIILSHAILMFKHTFHSH